MLVTPCLCVPCDRMLSESGVLANTLVAHTDAVWGLSIHASKSQLLSCSADGTVRLWEPGSKSPLLNTYRVEDEKGVPSSVDFCRSESSHMVAGYTSANAYIFDIETSQQLLNFDFKAEGKMMRFNLLLLTLCVGSSGKR